MYWKVIQAEFGVNLDLQRFMDRKDSWSERMRAVYELGGKRWTSSIESKMKEKIAQIVVEDFPQAIAKEYKCLVDNVVEAIVSLMDTP